MKLEKRQSAGPWDIAAGVAGGILLFVFLTFIIVCVLDFDSFPIAAFIIGIFLLLGIVFWLIVRNKLNPGKLRKLLLAGLISNGMVVLFGTVFFILLIIAVNSGIV